MRSRIAIMSLQPGNTHETVARVLFTRFEFDAQVIQELDPVAITMRVREAEVLVLVGEPTADNMRSPAIEEAISSMIPIIALCAGVDDRHDSLPGISFLLDPQLGPEHLATALSALISRQREIRRLQLDNASVMQFSGGLRHQIDNIQEELQLAASVQREFLPRILPSLGGIASAALWRPAAYVSGDIYNVMRLDEHHLGLFVTDAVGHGVPAALLTLVISRSLPTKEIVGNSYRILSPSEALAQVNADMMTRAGRTTRFATAIYAVIDTRNHQLTVASAGHLPLLRISRGGKCEAIQTIGGLLGVFEDETFVEKVITLSHGDKLLFYTDGFEQAFPELGQDPSAPRLPNRRYLDFFNEFASVESSSDFIDSINRRLDEESEDFPQIDDLTLLCASWTGV
ncbi:MAG: PP2C family protein-serine/threonine phosphatase [Planctomycetota bacterium]|nr:PP2C family protein-serine/threonine phosphatase [Planctomycetota bacterium]MDA1261427.1 PP2C family protein-serine/threonine phosphatase [Planctomycetota bacterium]